LAGALDLPGAPPNAGVRIICDASVSPCIQVGQGGGNGTAALKNVTVSHAGGTPASDIIGVKVLDGFNARLTDVMSYNSGQCVYFQSHPRIGAGISGTGSRISTGQCSDAHLVIDGWPELHLSDSRLGVNGIFDYAANTYIRVQCTMMCGGPSSPNTYLFSNNQFNQGGKPAAHFLEFVNLGGTVP
jgi:hypothetical protein